MKNGTPLWRDAHSSQNVQNKPGSEPFFKFRSAKMARRCGESQKGQNTTCSEPFFKFKNGTPLWRESHLQVKMLKNGTRLWREAHVQVKMYKISVFGTLFEVQMLKM